MSILRGILSPFVGAIYNEQAHDWDCGTVFSMLTGNDDLKGEDLALEEDSTIQQQLGEALDLLFQARGKPRIAQPPKS